MSAYPFPSSYNGQDCVGRTSSSGTQWYTGSGMTTDGHGPPIANDRDVTAWVVFYDDRIVNVCNRGINLAAGHDTRAYNNRFIHSGVIPNTNHTAAIGAGPGGVTDVYGVGAWFHDNSFDHNEYWWPTALTLQGSKSSVHDNVDLFVKTGAKPTRVDELAEYDHFLDAARIAGIVVGPE